MGMSFLVVVRIPRCFVVCENLRDWCSQRQASLGPKNINTPEGWLVQEEAKVRRHPSVGLDSGAQRLHTDIQLFHGRAVRRRWSRYLLTTIARLDNIFEAHGVVYMRLVLQLCSQQSTVGWTRCPWSLGRWSARK